MPGHKAGNHFLRILSQIVLHVFEKLYDNEQSHAGGMVGVPTLVFASQLRIPLTEVLWHKALHCNAKSVSEHKHFIHVNDCAAINIQISTKLLFQYSIFNTK